MPALRQPSRPHTKIWPLLLQALLQGNSEEHRFPQVQMKSILILVLVSILIIPPTIIIIMFESIAFLVALAGSSIGAAWDLKTTEIPDEIPYAMIAIALIIYGAQSLLAWDYWPIIDSVIVGSALFGFGFVMYHLGQWGGGDAKLLSAIGFLLPSLPMPLAESTANISVSSASFLSFYLSLPFPAKYVFNVFLVGAGYMMIYAFVIAARNSNVVTAFKKDMKASSNVFLSASVLLFVVFLLLNYFIYLEFQIPVSMDLILMNSAVILFATVGVFTVWRFARAVENVGFKKKIPVRRLRVGDVLLDSKVWEGIEEKDIRRIKRSGKSYVWIKEGVRFAPAFPFALLFMIYFGDAFLLLFRIFG